MIIEAVLAPHQRACVMFEPILQPREQKAQRGAACERRKRCDFACGERPFLGVRGNQTLGAGAAEASARFETPGVNHNGEIVCVVIVAGEIEIDESRNLSALGDSRSCELSFVRVGSFQPGNYLSRK